MVRRLFALSTAMLVSCSLLTDTSGIDDGVRDAGVDAFLDDGAMEADADRCAGAIFCDAFDEGTIASTWGEQHADLGAVRTERWADALSPPSVLFAQVTDPGPGAKAYVITSTTGDSASSASLTFSVWPESVGTAGGAAIGAFALGTHNLRVYAMKDKLRLVEDDTAAGPAYDVAPLAAGWTTITIGVAEGRIFLLRNGVKEIDEPAKSPWLPSPSRRAVVGIYFLLFSPAGTFGFRFDDVRFDVTK